MTDKEVMQMALDWVEMTHPVWNAKYSGIELKRMSILHQDTVSKIKEALWQSNFSGNSGTLAQPEKEWIGLTDEEIREGNRQSWVTIQGWESAVWWAEEKLKEKNT